MLDLSAPAFYPAVGLCFVDSPTVVDYQPQVPHDKSMHAHEGSNGAGVFGTQWNQQSAVSKPHQMEKDIWRQLKGFTIPVFDGKKRQYENWKAAFVACIHRQCTPFCRV